MTVWWGLGIVEGIVLLPVVLVGLWIGCGVLYDNCGRWRARRAEARKADTVANRIDRHERDLGMKL